MKLKDKFSFIVFLSIALISVNFFKYYDVFLFDQRGSAALALLPIHIIIMRSFQRKIYETNKIKLFFEISILTLFSWILFFAVKYCDLNFSVKRYLGFIGSLPSNHPFVVLHGQDLMLFELWKPFYSLVAIFIFIKYFLAEAFCSQGHGHMKLYKSNEFIIEGEDLVYDFKSKIDSKSFSSHDQIEQFLSNHQAQDTYSNFKLYKFSISYFKCNKCEEYFYSISIYQKKLPNRNMFLIMFLAVFGSRELRSLNPNPYWHLIDTTKVKFD